MSELVTLIEEAMADGNATLESAIFETNDASVIARQVETFLQSEFGADPQFIFYRHSVGVVVGARLGEQQVVLKIHRWLASIERLAAIQRVQGAYFSMGLPAPRPLVGPTNFAAGIATVEDFLAGDVADGHDSDVRRTLAHELQRFISAGRNVTDVRGLEPSALTSVPGDALWPTPHAPRFDFEATKGGAEWIDEFAHMAQWRLAGLKGEKVIGYLDWRVGNLGFVGSKMTAIYDWDSVGLATEAFIVGSAAATFSSDWSKANGSVPNLEEMRAFVSEYQDVRGRAFDGYELDVVDAANLVLIAYGARCQHSDAVLARDQAGAVARSWIELLKERGERGLLEG